MAPTRNNSNRRGNKFGNAKEKTQTKRYYGCGICKSTHRLVDCKKFERMNLAEKYKTAVKLHYCTNCLARNHLIAQCKNKNRCHKCSGKHHSTLHGPQRILQDLPSIKNNTTVTRASSPPVPAPRQLSTAQLYPTALPSSRTKTFVPTALIQVVSESETQFVRALLNPSLTTSRIAVSFVRKHNLALFKVGDKVFVKAVLASNCSPKVQYELCLSVVNDLPKLPYAGATSADIKDRVCRISLADPEFYLNSPVDLEIGGDLYTTIIRSNVIHIDGATLIAQDSTLGWLVMGSMSN